MSLVGIPAGINIPNYHDVRENDGFKVRNELRALLRHEPGANDLSRSLRRTSLSATSSRPRPPTKSSPSSLLKKWRVTTSGPTVLSKCRCVHLSVLLTSFRLHDPSLTPSFLQVCNHELLGHGTGKLFQEAADGSVNFDRENLLNPLTGEKITSWYKPGASPSLFFPSSPVFH